MITKDFPQVSAHMKHEPPHRAMSRAPSDHNITMILLGCAATVGVLAILWALYAYG